MIKNNCDFFNATQNLFFGVQKWSKDKIPFAKPLDTEITKSICVALFLSQLRVLTKVVQFPTWFVFEHEKHVLCHFDSNVLLVYCLDTLFYELTEKESLHLINDAKSVNFVFHCNSAMTTFVKWWSSRVTFHGKFGSSHYLRSGICHFTKLVMEETQVKRSGKSSFTSTSFWWSVGTASVIRNTHKQYYYGND